MVSEKILLHPGTGAEYCDQSVWVCVSVSGTAWPSSSNFLWMLPMPWLGPPRAVLWYVLLVLWMTSHFPIMSHIAACHYHCSSCSLQRRLQVMHLLHDNLFSRRGWQSKIRWVQVQGVGGRAWYLPLPCFFYCPMPILCSAHSDQLTNVEPTFHSRYMYWPMVITAKNTQHSYQLKM